MSGRKSKAQKAGNLQRKNVERKKVKTQRLAQQQEQANFQVLFDNLKRGTGNFVRSDGKRILCMLMLALFIKLCKEETFSGATKAVAVKEVAEISGHSTAALYRYLKEFSKDRALSSPLQRGRKRLDFAKRVYEGSQLHEAHIPYLDGWIIDLNATEGGVTLAKLQDLFEEHCNVEVPKHVLRTVMKRLGYTWGKAKRGSPQKLDREEYDSRVREFLFEYASALKRQASEEGKFRYVIVYMDESYCHQRHSKRYTWFHPDHDMKNTIFCGSGKGTRLIIVHAMTEEGMLFVDGNQRQGSS